MRNPHGFPSDGDTATGGFQLVVHRPSLLSLDGCVPPEGLEPWLILLCEKGRLFEDPDFFGAWVGVHFWKTDDNKY